MQTITITVPELNQIATHEEEVWEMPTSQELHDRRLALYDEMVKLEEGITPEFKHSWEAIHPDNM